MFITLLLCIVGVSLSAYKFASYSYALTDDEWYKDYDDGNPTLEEDNIILTKYTGDATEVIIPNSATINGKKY